MKFYPDPNKPKGSRGYTEEEILKGHHFLFADVTCTKCEKVQALSSVGYIGGPCIKCGSRTE